MTTIVKIEQSRIEFQFIENKNITYGFYWENYF